MLANAILPGRAAPTDSSADACAHCGLTLSGAVIEVEGVRFCCAGCSCVFAAIHGAGLGAFYADRDVGQASPARPTARR